MQSKVYSANQIYICSHNNFYHHHISLTIICSITKRCEGIKNRHHPTVQTSMYLCDRVGVEHFNRTWLNFDSVFHQHCQSLRERDDLS